MIIMNEQTVRIKSALYFILYKGHKIESTYIYKFITKIINTYQYVPYYR